MVHTTAHPVSHNLSSRGGSEGALGGCDGSGPVPKTGVEMDVDDVMKS